MLNFSNSHIFQTILPCFSNLVDLVLGKFSHFADPFTTPHKLQIHQITVLRGTILNQRQHCWKHVWAMPGFWNPLNTKLAVVDIEPTTPIRALPIIGCGGCLHKELESHVLLLSHWHSWEPSACHCNNRLPPLPCPAISTDAIIGW